ncbi:MAG: cupin domain-containing protein [Halobacteriaceae archaeon]
MSDARPRQHEVTTLAALTDTPHAEVFEPGTGPRVVRLALEADESVPPHTHPGTDVVLHVLDGQLELTLDGEHTVVDAGQVTRFSGEREISPRALEDSRALVVFAPTGDD